jgi:hypothetical protein
MFVFVAGLIGLTIVLTLDPRKKAWSFALVMALGVVVVQWLARR